MGYKFTTAGTWTPAVQFGGGSTGITYATNSGTYYIRENIVTASNYINPSSIGSSTGNFTIANYPYTSQNAGSPKWLAFLYLGASTGSGGGLTGNSFNPYISLAINSNNASAISSTTAGSTATTLVNTNCFNTMIMSSTLIYII